MFSLLGRDEFGVRAPLQRSTFWHGHAPGAAERASAFVSDFVRGRLDVAPRDDRDDEEDGARGGAGGRRRGGNGGGDGGAGAGLAPPSSCCDLMHELYHLVPTVAGFLRTPRGAVVRPDVTLDVESGGASVRAAWGALLRRLGVDPAAAVRQTPTAMTTAAAAPPNATAAEATATTTTTLGVAARAASRAARWSASSSASSLGALLDATVRTHGRSLFDGVMRRAIRESPEVRATLRALFAPDFACLGEALGWDEWEDAPLGGRDAAAAV